MRLGKYTELRGHPSRIQGIRLAAENKQQSGQGRRERMEGEEKNGETGEGVEKKGRRRLFPLLQEFLWVPMVV